VRRYTTDSRPGAGVHNWLHGMLEDSRSPITVGDPRSNLPNILFWRIHGWIEAKWKAFEAVHKRSADEEQLYQGFITLFRAHMVRMSENAASAPAAALPGGAANSCSIALTKRVDCGPRDRNACVLAGCCWYQVSRGPSCYKQDNHGIAGFVPGAPPQPQPTTTVKSSWWSRALQGVRTSARRVQQDVNQLVADAGANSRDAKYGGMFFKMQENLKAHHMRRKRSPWAIVKSAGPYMFRNHIRDCAALARGTTSDDCPQGNRSPGVPAASQPRPHEKFRRGSASLRGQTPRFSR